MSTSSNSSNSGTSSLCEQSICKIDENDTQVEPLDPRIQVNHIYGNHAAAFFLYQ